MKRTEFRILGRQYIRIIDKNGEAETIEELIGVKVTKYAKDSYPGIV